MPTSLIGNEFLEQKILAVVGVSTDREKYGNIVFRRLKDCGLTVYPVNPYNSQVEGEICYNSLKDLPEKVDGIIVVVPPKVTEAIVRDAHELGIQRIWMQPGAQSIDAEKYCKDVGIVCIAGECILISLKDRK